MASGEGRKKFRIYLRCSLVGFFIGLFAGFLVSSLVCYFLYRPLSKVHREVPVRTTPCGGKGPSLGRSFIYGFTLVHGSLQTQRSGIYGIYVQVTLAKCIQARSPDTDLREVKTLTIGILSAQGRHSSLLRRHLQERCSLSASLQVNLSFQDTLYVNLTYPLVPSPNSDETFFGASWLCPPPLSKY